MYEFDRSVSVRLIQAEQAGLVRKRMKLEIVVEGLAEPLLLEVSSFPSGQKILIFRGFNLVHANLHNFSVPLPTSFHFLN